MTLEDLLELNEYTQIMESYEEEANRKAAEDAKRNKRK